MMFKTATYVSYMCLLTFVLVYTTKINIDLDLNYVVNTTDEYSLYLESNPPSENLTDYDREIELKRYLFTPPDKKHYDPTVRPVRYRSTTTNVTMIYELYGIIELDEQEEVLKSIGRFNLQWTDELLKWHPMNEALMHNKTFFVSLSRDYSRKPSIEGSVLLTLQIPQYQIWRPDLRLINSFKRSTILGDRGLQAEVTFYGSVFWEPFQVIETSCNVDITYFPYDTQTCYIKYAVGGYNSSEVQIISNSSHVSLEHYEQNSQWSLISTKVEVENQQHVTPYKKHSVIKMELVIKRKPAHYIFNLIVPLMLISVLNALTFILPAGSGERAGYAVTVYLALAVFYTVTAEILPANSEQISLTSIYLTFVNIFSNVIVFVSLYQVRLVHRDSTEIGSFYLNVYTIVNKIRCCRRKSIARDKKSSTTSLTHDATLPTWTDIANALDTVFFWFCFLAIVVIIVTLRVIVAINR